MKKKIIAGILVILMLSSAVAVGAATVITQDLEIWLVGDTNGDSGVDIFDLVAVNNHIQQNALLNDYSYDCGDVNNDTSVDIFDLVAINNHIQGTVPLW